MKFRTKQSTCILALAVLAVAVSGAVWAAAIPGNTQKDTFYFNNAAHTTVVGEFTLISCTNGGPVGWGQRTAYSTTVVQKCY